MPSSVLELARVTRLTGFALSFYLICCVKLSVLGWTLNVIAHQGLWRHLLNLVLFSPLVVLLCVLPKRHWAALGAQLVLSTVCVMHVVAWRALGDILSMMSVEQLTLVGYAGAGFVRSLIFSDAFYFLDLPIWIYWICRPPCGRLSVWRSLLTAAGLSILVQAVVWSTFSAIDKSRLESRRKNLGVMVTAGVVEYHLVDARDFFSEFVAPDRFAPIPNDWIEENSAHLRASWADSNSYQGAWKGKNLWFIQLESLQAFSLNAQVDGQPVMPFLRSLAGQSVLFNHCYDQTASGVSLDCDFLINNSLLPSVGRPTFYRYRNTEFYSLTHVLNELGYLTIYTQDSDPSFFNLPVISKHFGYTIRRFVGETPPTPKADELIGSGMRDYALLFRVMKGLEAINGRFSAHIICPMAHAPFKELTKQQELLKLPKNLENTMMGDYLQMCRFRDRDLERWFAEFKASPLADNTTLCIYGDHSAPLTRQDFGLLWGRPVDALEQADQQRIVILFYDGKHQARIEKVCGLIDFAPTILYLLGATNVSPVWLGRNIFSPEPSTVVCRRYGFVMTPDGIRGLDDSEKNLPPLPEAENEKVRRQLILSERLCLQNQIRKFVKGAAP